ncbi:hypothetical protein P167DRAFT_543604 [Morchella conica CCBAS932]|uniref:Uncharacterized protein n=1 Tax=Morchella conica CCBAS932 TaxID=1392247 RepID=A0A3N4KWH9_9PEZI|nr:hypothetical protein P167DRAFT_543604 [Morchella conica CCBAS932]
MYYWAANAIPLVKCSLRRWLIYVKSLAVAIFDQTHYLSDPTKTESKWHQGKKSRKALRLCGYLQWHLAWVSLAGYSGQVLIACPEYTASLGCSTLPVVETAQCRSRSTAPFLACYSCVIMIEPWLGQGVIVGLSIPLKNNEKGKKKSAFRSKYSHMPIGGQNLEHIIIERNTAEERCRLEDLLLSPESSLLFCPHIDPDPEKSFPIIDLITPYLWASDKFAP